MVAGPGWKGETPPGIKKVFRCETQFSLVGYRTQLLGPMTWKTLRKCRPATKDALGFSEPARTSGRSGYQLPEDQQGDG